MEDIGVVEYTPDKENKLLHADWHYIKEGKKAAGTGVAAGELSDGFEGEYIVTYYNLAGKELSKFNLSIARNEDCFELTWSKDGKNVYSGLGIERNGKLYAGWRCC